jgi:hypothetical protein
VTKVFVEQAQTHALESLGDGHDLGEHVDAVLVVLDHPLEAPHLPFDPPQAVPVLGLLERVAAGGHDDLLPGGNPGGVYYPRRREDG